MNKRLLSTKEAATHCGLSTEKFMQLVNDKIAPQPIYHPDVKKRLWDIQDLDRYIDQLKGGSNYQTQSVDLFRQELANATQA